MYSSPISLHLKNYMCGSVLACPWNYNLAILSYEHWQPKKYGSDPSKSVPKHIVLIYEHLMNIK